MVIFALTFEPVKENQFIFIYYLPLQPTLQNRRFMPGVSDKKKNPQK